MNASRCAACTGFVTGCTAADAGMQCWNLPWPYHYQQQPAQRMLQQSHAVRQMMLCVQVGYGRKTYEATKELLSSWGQFQLPWAQVDPATPIKAGTPVCVSANVFGVWTAVPLKIV